MELYKVVTSKGKVFENVRAEDIIFSHKIGKIRGGSKIQDGNGKWFRVEEFVKNKMARGNLEKFKKEVGNSFSSGNAKVLEIMAGKNGTDKEGVSNRNAKKYFLLDGRMFLLAGICFGSILLNVVLVFYYDLGNRKGGEWNIGAKDPVFESKPLKNKKLIAAKTKVEKKKVEEMDLISRKSEGYYRNIDEKSFEDEKSRILQNEKSRLDK